VNRSHCILDASVVEAKLKAADAETALLTLDDSIKPTACMLSNTRTTDLWSAEEK
jgi:hypothetical protein